MEKHKNIRLDKYMTQEFPQYSRAFLKSQIKQGNVLVNGKIKKPSYALKKNDKIEIKIATPKRPILKPNNDIKLSIVYEDSDIIVIDKPAGIATHPARQECYNTIANALLAHYPPIKDVGDMPEFRPGIVHRLDKDTSGLMVVAKNYETFAWLKKQFQERKVVKKYLALVAGKIKKDKGIISKAISRAKGSIKRTTTPQAVTREAVTYYKAIERFLGYTLIEAKPKTGRTHQIRVHLASIGHPIAGDKLYGFKRQSPLAGLKRQFLHASYLKFILPDGKMVEFMSELPRDLKDAIKNLKS